MRFIGLILVLVGSLGQARELSGQLFVTPEDQHVPFVEAINQAKTNIRLAMYHLTANEPIQALELAAKRGVQVRILHDRKSMTNEKYQKVARRLMEAGAEFRPGSPAFSIQHEKAMLVDNELLFVTSINLTSKAALTRDYGVIFRDQPSLIQEFQSVFDSDWEHFEDKKKVTPQLSDSNLIWSPVNAKSRLMRLVQSARESIIGQAENIGDADFLKALGESAQSGVRVRMIFPYCGLGDNPAFNYPAYKVVMDMGVETRLMPVPSTSENPFIHAKMLVIDGEQIYVGSQNFSFNSLNFARELGVIFGNKQVAGRIGQVFERDWMVSVGVPKEQPKSCDPYGLQPSGIFDFTWLESLNRRLF